MTELLYLSIVLFKLTKIVLMLSPIRTSLFTKWALTDSEAETLPNFIALIVPISSMIPVNIVLINISFNHNILIKSFHI